MSNDIINQLHDYMLNNDVIKRSMFYKPENKKNKEKIEINKQINKEKPQIFIPNKKDTLFWCFYFLKYNEIPENTNIVFEKKIKFEYIDKIRQNKQLIKSYKFATFSHLENQIANEEKIDLATFFTICVIENINILYIFKKTYFELLINADDKIHIISHINNSKYNNSYGYEGDDISKIEIYKSTLFKVDNIEKPIKSISAYKISELIDFCNKLDIKIINDKDKKKSKKELYESIVQYF
jgi:hypothetical protein